MRYEPFRHPETAKVFADQLEKAGRVPLIIEGRPDRYNRTVTMVIWFAI